MIVVDRVTLDIICDQSELIDSRLVPPPQSIMDLNDYDKGPLTPLSRFNIAQCLKESRALEEGLLTVLFNCSMLNSSKPLYD